MGAGNKLDPTAFRVADIYKTKVCPLAKVMRIECRKRRVKKLEVVYSEEQPTRPIEDMSISCRTTVSAHREHSTNAPNAVIYPEVQPLCRRLSDL